MKSRSRPSEVLRDKLEEIKIVYERDIWLDKSLPWEPFYDTLWIRISTPQGLYRYSIRQATPGPMTPEIMDILAEHLEQWAQDKLAGKIK